MADGGILEAALIISAVAGAASTVYSATQKPSIPKPPDMPEKFNNGPKQADVGAVQAQRQKALLASGRQGTIMTSPLGEVGGGNPGTGKTLLGM